MSQHVNAIKVNQREAVDCLVAAIAQNATRTNKPVPRRLWRICKWGVRRPRHRRRDRHFVVQGSFAWFRIRLASTNERSSAVVGIRQVLVDCHRRDDAISSISLERIDRLPRYYANHFWMNRWMRWIRPWRARAKECDVVGDSLRSSSKTASINKRFDIERHRNESNWRRNASENERPTAGQRKTNQTQRGFSIRSGAK